MRTRELGLRPRPKLFKCSGFYPRFDGDSFDNDDAGLGQGLGIFADIREALRQNVYEIEEINLFTRKPRVHRDVVETWKQLRLSIIVGRYICDFYIRLKRIK